MSSRIMEADKSRARGRGSRSWSVFKGSSESESESAGVARDRRNPESVGRAMRRVMAPATVDTPARLGARPDIFVAFGGCCGCKCVRLDAAVAVQP